MIPQSSSSPRKATKVEKERKALTVYTAPGSRKTTDTKTAVRNLNREVGAQVVRTTKKRRKADVVVKANLKNPKLEGLAYSTGRVRMKPNASVRTLEHELGHELGLGHKEEKFGTYNKKSKRWTTTANRNNLMTVSGIGGKGKNLHPGQKNKVVRKVKGGKRVTYKKPS
jgi:hypothetical protein